MLVEFLKDMKGLTLKSNTCIEKMMATYFKLIDLPVIAKNFELCLSFHHSVILSETLTLLITFEQ